MRLPSTQRELLEPLSALDYRRSSAGTADREDSLALSWPAPVGKEVDFLFFTIETGATVRRRKKAPIQGAFVQYPGGSGGIRTLQ
jgi:hypothetical protein